MERYFRFTRHYLAVNMLVIDEDGAAHLLFIIVESCDIIGTHVQINLIFLVQNVEEKDGF